MKTASVYCTAGERQRDKETPSQKEEKSKEERGQRKWNFLKDIRNHREALCYKNEICIYMEVLIQNFTEISPSWDWVQKHTFSLNIIHENI